MSRWQIAGISAACVLAVGFIIAAILVEPRVAPAGVMMGMWAAILWWMAWSER